MCGIVGYIGKDSAVSHVTDGLKKMLPRGYDSAGVGVVVEGKIKVVKDVLPKGAMDHFLAIVQGYNGVLVGSGNAIGHTRWATHGGVSKVNAHPHLDGTGEISVVHNGVIENWRELKKYLEEEQGCTIVSETDSELVSHLFGVKLAESSGNIRQAILATVASLQGAFGLVIQHAKYPAMLIGVRHGSPLCYAKLKDGSFMIASTAEPFIGQTRSVKYLGNGELIIIDGGKVTELSFDNQVLNIPSARLEGTLEDVQKEGFEHFMLKEIMTQPLRLPDVLLGRLNYEIGDVKLGGLEHVLPKLERAEQVFWLGSGTSYHASMICSRMFRDLGIRSQAVQASEVRADNILAGCNPAKTVVVGLSQSGETKDLISALEEMKQRNVGLILGVVNVVDSSVARLTEAGVYLRVGPEMGVASTKAFSAQVLVGAMIALLLARKRGLSVDLGREWLSAIEAIPKQIQIVLEQAEHIKTIAKKMKGKSGVMLLGRSYQYPTVLEGGLKIKEVAYLHCEVQPAGEMKHGPIAMIEEGYPVFVIAPQDNERQRIFSGISEIRARGAWVVGICTSGDEGMCTHVNECITIPAARPELATILASVVLQLVAYYLGVLRGNNVDQPRNLAKAVTVD